MGGARVRMLLAARRRTAAAHTPTTGGPIHEPHEGGIIDDHAVFAESLSLVLADAATASSGSRSPRGRARAADGAAEVCLIDLRFPSARRSTDGPLRAASPPTSFVVLTGFLGSRCWTPGSGGVRGFAHKGRRPATS